MPTSHKRSQNKGHKNRLEFKAESSEIHSKHIQTPRWKLIDIQNKMEKMMSRVHTWKASSPMKARLTSNSIFITFLGDAQLKTFSERIPSSASLAYPAQKLLKNISSRKYLSPQSLRKIPKEFSPLRKVTLEKSPRKPPSLFLSLSANLLLKALSNIPE